MKRVMIFSLLIFISSLVFAQNAIIQEISGTVELQLAGTITWEPAVEGQSVPVDTVISTGFKSTVVIKLGDTIINVHPITRLTVTELSSRTDLDLHTGRIKADITPPSEAKAEFTVRSPTTTASVRGTVFEIDTVNLWVIEGSVEYRGVNGAPVIIDAGRSSYVDDRNRRAVFPLNVLMAELRPDMPIATELVSSPGRSIPGLSQREFEINTEIDFD